MQSQLKPLKFTQDFFASYQYPIFRIQPQDIFSFTDEQLKEQKEILKLYKVEGLDSHEIALESVVLACKKNISPLLNAFASLLDKAPMLESDFESHEEFMDFYFDVSDVKSLTDIFFHLLNGMNSVVQTYNFEKNKFLTIFIQNFNLFKGIFNESNLAHQKEHTINIWTFDRWFLPSFYELYLNIPSSIDKKLPEKLMLQATKSRKDKNSPLSNNLSNEQIKFIEECSSKDHTQISAKDLVKIFKIYHHSELLEIRLKFKNGITSKTQMGYYAVKDFFHDLALKNEARIEKFEDFIGKLEILIQLFIKKVEQSELDSFCLEEHKQNPYYDISPGMPPRDFTMCQILFGFLGLIFIFFIFLLLQLIKRKRSQKILFY
jgi:hypothetical protein